VATVASRSCQTLDRALAMLHSFYFPEAVKAFNAIPAANAITHFARALGAPRLGDAAAAQADIDKIAALREAHLKASQPYWAEQVEVQLLAARAWSQRVQGHKDKALKLMRAAADLEDGSEKHVAMENRLYPMRELLADMLLEGGDAAAR
jgi:hypothetical protein